MSFGWSAGDIVLAINLAVKVYNNYRSSCGELYELTQDIDGFKNVLQQVHKAFRPIDLDLQQQKGLGVLGNQAVKLLSDLNEFLEKNVHPVTGKLTPSKRLFWRASNAEKLRKRMHNLTVNLSTYQNVIINVAIHENGRAILEALTKPDKLSEVQKDILEAPALAELRTALNVPFDTGWAIPIAEHTAEERKTTPNTAEEDNAEEEDIAYDLHGSTLVNSISAPAKTSMDRVSTGSSGATTSSSSRKASFLDNRPKDPPLAIHLRRRTYTESSSGASLKSKEESKDKEPPPQRRAVTSPFKNLTHKLPGSSAPSMTQQRLPFGPGLVSPSRPPKTKT